MGNLRLVPSGKGRGPSGGPSTTSDAPWPSSADTTRSLYVPCPTTRGPPEPAVTCGRPSRSCAPSDTTPGGRVVAAAGVAGRVPPQRHLARPGARRRRACSTPAGVRSGHSHRLPGCPSVTGRSSRQAVDPRGRTPRGSGRAGSGGRDTGPRRAAGRDPRPQGQPRCLRIYFT